MPDCPHLEQQQHDGQWTCLACHEPTHDTPAAIIVTRGLDAIQNTSGRPSTDFEGSTD